MKKEAILLLGGISALGIYLWHRHEQVAAAASTYQSSQPSTQYPISISQGTRQDAGSSAGTANNQPWTSLVPGGGSVAASVSSVESGISNLWDSLSGASS